ncbi:MAG: hypothetical protein ABEH66_00675 [Halobacteriales archaeon]
MPDNRDGEAPGVLVRYGRPLAVVVLKYALAVGGLAVIFLGLWWVNANVLEPTLGSHGLLLTVLYVAILLGYVVLLSRLAASDTQSDSEVGSTVEGENWGAGEDGGADNWGGGE